MGSAPSGYTVPVNHHDRAPRAAAVLPSASPVPVDAEVPPLVELSRREAQVLHLVSEGLSNQEIADALYLSINSVKTYIRAAYRKIGVTKRVQAVAWVIRNPLPQEEALEEDQGGGVAGRVGFPG
jgi:DNA-binding CsgD family transcriptional regulator